MKTILDSIAQQKLYEIAELKKNFRLADFESMEGFHSPSVSLVESLKEHQFGIIAEFKRKSPSAGTINMQLPPEKQAQSYENAGAAAISCVTDHTFFGGSMDDLKTIKNNVSIPVLRKDFILDEIQLFEAKAYGADAILLISELLNPSHAEQLTIIAQSLGMEVLMEAHDRLHLSRIPESVDLIGINNRDLHMQQTSLQTSFDLFDFIPKNSLCISESGIRSRHELLELEKTGYNGALVGESLMKSNDPSLLITNDKKPISCS